MSDRRSFSLPELLVSCGALGLVMAGVASVFRVIVQVNRATGTLGAQNITLTTMRAE